MPTEPLLGPESRYRWLTAKNVVTLCSVLITAAALIAAGLILWLTHRQGVEQDQRSVVASQQRLVTLCRIERLDAEQQAIIDYVIAATGGRAGFDRAGLVHALKAASDQPACHLARLAGIKDPFADTGLSP